MNSDLRAVAPEIILILFASVFFLRRSKHPVALVYAALGLGALATFFQWSHPLFFFDSSYEIHKGTTFLKVMILASAAISVHLFKSDPEISRHRPELLALMLIATAGGILLVSARHLALIYLAFEMLSIPSYALVGSIPGSSKSNEAGIKYAIFGGTSSALLLYGFSILYGISGSLRYDQIMTASGPALPIAAVLIGAGAMYKLAAAPFHYWIPDAFEGAPISIAAFLSAVPKIAAVGMILTLSSTVPHESWRTLLTVLAVVSMTWGNLAALNQNSIKRLLAYSAVAHAGTMLVGLSLLTQDGYFAALFYLAVYLLMNLGAFTVAGRIGPDPSVEDFRKLSTRSPLLAFSMAVFLLSLTGLPPFGGFIGKFLIVAAALEADAYLLAAALIINTVISLYYYARILRAMYLEPGSGTAIVPGFLAPALAALVLIAGLWWEPLARFAQQAVGFK